MADEYLDTQYGPLFQREGRIYLKGRDGLLQSTETENAAQFLRSGEYKPATAQDVHKVDHQRRVREFSKKEGALGTVQAGVEATGRSIIDTALLPAQLAGIDTPTGGEVLESLGVDPEKQRMRAEASPIAAAVGGMAPDIAAGLATGGGSAAGKFGLKQLAKSAGKQAAVGAALGARAGGQLEMERAWRTNTPVDSERLVSQVGVGSLLGGGLGGVGGALGDLVVAGAARGADVASRVGGLAADVAGPLGAAGGALSVAAPAARGAPTSLGSRVSAAAGGLRAAGAALKRVKPKQAAIFGKAVAAPARAMGRPQLYASLQGDIANQTMAQRSIELQQLQDRSRRNVQDGIAHAAEGAGRAWSATSGVGNYRDYPMGQFRYPGESRREAFFGRTREMAALAANPELLINKVSESAQPLSFFSPQLSRDVIDTSLRAVQFMERFGRASMSVPDPLNPHETEGTNVSDQSIEQYERLWNAAMFPGTIVDELANWDLREETMTALQEVHPHYLQDVKEQVATRLYSTDWKPTYQQRLQIGMLLGVQDKTVQPKFQARIAGYARAAQVSAQQPTGGGRPGRPRGRPTAAQQFRTVSQRIGTEREGGYY